MSGSRKATLIRSPRLDSTRIITKYFRKKFVATNLWATTNLYPKVLRDEGCLGYLNEVEVFGNNIQSVLEPMQALLSAHEFGQIR